MRGKKYQIRHELIPVCSALAVNELCAGNERAILGAPRRGAQIRSKNKIMCFVVVVVVVVC